MRSIMVVVATGFAAMLISAPVFADMDKDDSGKSGDKREMYMKMAQERHEMSIDMMKMLRDTMEIVKNLEHRPTAEEKEKLGKMISQMDEMISKHEKIYEEHRKIHQDMMDNGDRMMQHERMMQHDRIMQPAQ